MSFLKPILWLFLLCLSVAGNAQDIHFEPSPGGESGETVVTTSSSRLSASRVSAGQAGQVSFGAEPAELFGNPALRCLDPDSRECCGDGICFPGENCEIDCGYCGNGQCGINESCSTCAADCGACAACGDGVCNGTETCFSCDDCQSSCFFSSFQTFYRGENNKDIYFNWSDDGINWRGDRTLRNGAQSRRGPAAVIFNGRMFVFYRGNNNPQIYVSYSDNGLNWFGNHQLGNGAATDESPGVVVFNNKIHLIYKGESSSAIWLSTSSDGLNWDSQRKIINHPFGTEDSPSLVVVNNILYLFYMHEVKDSFDPDFVIGGFYTFTGDVWTQLNFAGSNLSLPGFRSSTGVSLTEHKGKVFMAFTGAWTKNIYITESNDLRLGNWSPYRQVLNARGEERPTLVSDGDQLVLQWKGVNTNRNYYAVSPDGVTWSGNAESWGKTLHGGPFMVYSD